MKIRKKKQELPESWESKYSTLHSMVIDLPVAEQNMIIAEATIAALGRQALEKFDERMAHHSALLVKRVKQWVIEARKRLGLK